MCDRFFAIPYDEIINNEGKLKKEFIKFVENTDVTVTLHQDSYDKIISDVLKKQAELYFYDESNIFCDNKELVINVLDEIWQDKILYNTIKKLLYRKLFISIMENEK